MTTVLYYIFVGALWGSSRGITLSLLGVLKGCQGVAGLASLGVGKPGPIVGHTIGFRRPKSEPGLNFNRTNTKRLAHHGGVAQLVRAAES